jgi:SAM-dependent methyltransferase
MTESFSADWLELRAAADRAARNTRLQDNVRRWAYRWQQQQRGQTLQIVDLGCGSGANLRHLVPHLGRRQNWLLLDHDPRLLSAAGERLQHWAADQGFQQRSATRQQLAFASARHTLAVTLQQCDLRHIPALIWPAQLITASALLDLTSAAWLRQLARDCHHHGAALLMTLSYSGELRWAPEDEFDSSIEHCFNRHQRGDKTFGSALGPDAAGYLAACLRQLGYRVTLAPSPWQLDGADTLLQQALITGFAQAAREICPQHETAINDWLERRHRNLAQTRLRIGHVDLFARLEPQ